MKFEFFSKAYEEAYGAKPKGRGAWAFEVWIHAGGRGATPLPTMFFVGTLAAGKKAVKAEAAAVAKTIGGAEAATVEILP